LKWGESCDPHPAVSQRERVAVSDFSLSLWERAG